jgi:hypothetical protein
LYVVTRDDHIKGVPETVTCENDQEALRKAEQIVDSHDIELWSGNRRVGRIKAAGGVAAMSNRPTPLERAFQLARSGRPNTIADIKQILHSEGYASGQVEGKALHKQLRALILAARAPRAAAPDVRAE